MKNSEVKKIQLAKSKGREPYAQYPFKYSKFFTNKHYIERIFTVKYYFKMDLKKEFTKKVSERGMILKSF